MLDSAWFQKPQFCNRANYGGMAWGRGARLLEARKQGEVGQSSRDKMYPAKPHH